MSALMHNTKLQRNRTGDKVAAGILLRHINGARLSSLAVSVSLFVIKARGMRACVRVRRGSLGGGLSHTLSGIKPRRGPHRELIRTPSRVHRLVINA